MSIQVSEDHVDAEMERVQQHTTAALQQIDENFSTCNRHLIQLSSEVDRYGAITQQIWDNSQKWVSFFRHLKETPSQILNDDTSIFSNTNRPPLEEHTGLQKRGMFSMKGRRTPLSDTFSSPMPLPTLRDNVLKKYRAETPSTSSSLYSNQLRQSPPRTIPYTITESQLQGTPIREQVQMLTENTIRSVGIRSSDDEELFSGVKESTQQDWGDFDMNEENPESRARFEQFLEDRQPLKKRPRDESEAGHEFSDGIMQYGASVVGYEFSDGLQYNEGLTERGSYLSSLSSRDGRTSMIPAQFNLQVFPEQFRTPPGSIKLTKVYDLFNERPGTMLTVKDILSSVKDDDYTETAVDLLISLLERKKYIKKVGKREAWVIRR